MGKETRHELHALPTRIVQGLGGYHAAVITADNHNLFEEALSLAIAGDMVMTLASPDDEPIPNFRVGKPAGSNFTKNLVGNITPIGPRRPEIRQQLTSYGITLANFPEYVVGTCFNLRYIRAISDILRKFETFRTEKVQFKNLTISGGETQVIKSKPSEPEPQRMIIRGFWCDSELYNRLS